MTLLQHLSAIRDERGQLNPALVVDAARDPNHPLHHRFEWDDTVAAEKWRLEQASQLLRIVKLPADPARPHHLRAYVAVQGKDTHRADYIPTGEALADDFTRKLVLSAMERDWRVLKRRYENMKEFAALVMADLIGEAS